MDVFLYTKVFTMIIRYLGSKESYLFVKFLAPVCLFPEVLKIRLFNQDTTI